MPGRKAARVRSVEQDHLRKLLAKGYDSPVLQARLAFKEADGHARYAKVMQEKECTCGHKRERHSMVSGVAGGGRLLYVHPQQGQTTPSNHHSLLNRPGYSGQGGQPIGRESGHLSATAKRSPSTLQEDQDSLPLSGKRLEGSRVDDDSLSLTGDTPKSQSGGSIESVENGALGPSWPCTYPGCTCITLNQRIHPGMLPTQASGRWSTVDPPLVNFPPSLSDSIMPDEGTYWLHWDWRSIELLIASAYCGDTAVLEAFYKGWDLHTITCCQIFKHSLPPDLVNPHGCENWRETWVPIWGGKEDRRRHLAKTTTYEMIYGSRPQNDFARAYLLSKPHLVAWKNKVWAECAEKGVSYTFLGRRRRLFGDHMERAKMGLNHQVQGAVADMMNLCLADILVGHPELGGWLVVNKHDGAILAFPTLSTEPSLQLTNTMSGVVNTCRQIVHREWQIAGQSIAIQADWKLTNDTGITTTIGATESMLGAP